MKHKIITAILIFILIGVIGSTGGKSKNKAYTNSKGTVQKQEQKQEKAPEPMKIVVAELADDFDSNQVAAEKKWNGKLVQFSAEITNITDSGLSFSKIASKEFSLTQIGCRINNKDQVLSLKNGQTVTVKGVVGNQTIGVIEVSDCQVVK